MGVAWLRSAARARFLVLSPKVRRSVLRAAGRRAPWDPGFDFTPPAVGPDLVTGPPDFVGVGVQRAGTTWWFSLIEQHPQLYSHPGLHKERHFFARFSVDTFDEGHVAQYHGWFPRPPGRRTGEWTPDYVAWPWAPPFLRRAAPDARLLVLLRDPVERYRSGLAHVVDVGDRIGPVSAADAFTRGLYAAQLERLELVYPPTQILVLQFERCRDDPSTQLARTFSFLGVSDDFQPAAVDDPVSASARKPALDDQEHSWLVELYTDDVRRLVQRHPEIDLKLWPNFAFLAG